MTDWLPWGAVVMVGLFGTLALLLRQLGRTRPGERANLKPVWWGLAASTMAALTMYSLYLLYGESWVWYLRR